MPETVSYRTARIAHLCESCQGVASLRTLPTIAPGHRYLLHTQFPGWDNTAEAPWSMKECISCAVERGVSFPAEACETFCCGTMPCAKPMRHDHDHSCRRCIETDRLALNHA